MTQVTNVAGDPAFKPSLRIPLPDQVGIRRVPKECQDLVSSTDLVNDLMSLYDFKHVPT